MNPLLVIAGPCVIEDEGFVLEVAEELKQQTSGLPIDFYFKASFDKANRSSLESFRGPGLIEGLKTLEKVKTKTGLKVLTDFHEPSQAEKVAEAVDFIQIPAFLCRQTDMIVAGALACIRYDRSLNIKKGQFLAPESVKNILQKVESVEDAQGRKLSSTKLWVTERGVSFGYQDLIVDMTSFSRMKKLGAQTIFDATHSVQKPGQGPDGKTTGGAREQIEPLARAAMAAGAQGVFLECHPQPAQAKSDGPNAFYLNKVGEFVSQLIKIRDCTSALPNLI